MAEYQRIGAISQICPVEKDHVEVHVLLRSGLMLLQLEPELPGEFTCFARLFL